MQKILIIDDEKDIVELIKYNLEKAGFEVEGCYDGKEALDTINRYKPSLLVLDWMLPNFDGLEICKALRQNHLLRRLPIIMLSAKGEEFDKVLALELGADDYMSKPFSTRELIARAKALLRRNVDYIQNTEDKNSVLFFKGISIDTIRYETSIDSTVLNLTKTEFELLLSLARQPERVFSRDQLLYSVWGQDFYGDDRVVDVHIRRLRSKIEAVTTQEYVKTVRGVGYKFSDKT